MNTIPQKIVTVEELLEWSRLKEELRELTAKEMTLRRKIFSAYFPAPKEGTNSYPLAAGYIMKGGYKIDRQIDLGALGAMKDQIEKANLSIDKLVRYKPELVVKEYRTLTAEETALFDRVLIVKPGAPSLEIVLPAKAAKAGEKA